MDAPYILTLIYELYGTWARVERYDLSSTLCNYKLSKGGQVGPYVVQIIGYIKRLVSLGFIMNNELVIDLILKSFPLS